MWGGASSGWTQASGSALLLKAASWKGHLSPSWNFPFARPVFCEKSGISLNAKEPSFALWDWPALGVTWEFPSFLSDTAQCYCLPSPPTRNRALQRSARKIQLCAQVTDSLPCGSTPVDTECAMAFPEFTLSDSIQFNSTNVY